MIDLTRIVKTYSVPLEKLEVITEVERIIAKDKSKSGIGNVSQLIVLMLEKFVKEHQNNPIPLLDKWLESPFFISLPTMGEPLNNRLKSMNDDEIQELRGIARKRLEEIKEEAGRRSLSLSDRCSKPLSILKSDFAYLTTSLNMNPKEAIDHIKKIDNLTDFEVNELMRELGIEVEKTIKEKKASNPMTP